MGSSVVTVFADTAAVCACVHPRPTPMSTSLCQYVCLSASSRAAVSAVAKQLVAYYLVPCSCMCAQPQALGTHDSQRNNTVRPRSRRLLLSLSTCQLQGQAQVKPPVHKEAFNPSGQAQHTQRNSKVSHELKWCLYRWLSQARQEFTQGAQEHLVVTGVECDDLVQEGLQALDQEMQAWVEQLRQNKVWLKFS